MRLGIRSEWVAPKWAGLWLRDSTTLAASQLGALAVTTVLAILVARYLGPVQFGTFAGFLGLSQVVTLLAGVGIPVWLLRELSRIALEEDGLDAREASSILSGAVGVVLALTVALTLGALLLGSAITSVDLALALGGLMGYVGLMSCAAVLEVVFRVKRRTVLILGVTLIEKIILLAMVATVTVAGVGIAGIACAYIVAGLLRVTSDILIIHGGRMMSVSRPTRHEMTNVVRRSLRIGAGTTIPQAVARLDVFNIGLYSATTAGLFAVADRMVSVLLILPVACSYALYPHLASDGRPLRSTLRLAAILALVAVPIAVGGVIVADRAIVLMFAERYEDAAVALRIMLLALPVMFAVNVLMAGLFSGAHERRALVVLMSSALAGTVLVVAGALLFGLKGAAAGYAMRYVLSLAALVRLAVDLNRAEIPLDQNYVTSDSLPPAVHLPGP